VVTDAEPRQRGFFTRLKQRLNRGRSWLSTGVAAAFGRDIDEDTLTCLEDELLLADVGVEATEDVIAELRRMAHRAENADVPLRELLRRVIAGQLEALEQPLEIGQGPRPRVILVVGVNGTGKTTTIGKLAHRLRRSGLSVLLAAGDTFRAAAAEQLALWAERSGAEIVRQTEGADPAAVVHDALAAARARSIDVVLADTAGRLHTSGGLMDELEKIGRVVRRFDESAPHEVLLVLDATQGQNALAQAVEFRRRIGVTGLVITKLDGSAKGGIVLAIGRRLGLPIRFVAVGEAIEDFEVFRAGDFAAALVGSGP
jgi:fused signal recognition particle receptor